MNPARDLNRTDKHPQTQPHMRLMHAGMNVRNAAANSLETGEVLCVQPRGYVVCLEQEQVTAARAAGCLLAPGVGDRVLLLREKSGACFVLNVLVADGNESRLEFPGQVRLEAPDVSISGSRSLHLQGAEVGLQGVQGKVSFLRLELAAKSLQARVQKVRGLAASLTLRLGRCLRLVGEEQLRARRLKTRVTGRWSVAAEDAEITAHKDVKVDGEQVLLG